MPKNKASAPKIENLKDVLKAAKPRPDDSGSRDDKIQYASRFANAMAVCIANGLRDKKTFQDVLPRSLAEGNESPVRSTGGTKRLDVNFSTAREGLGLLVSLTSVHFADQKKKTKLYTHNVKRNDEELRVEAMACHERTPYAVLVAVLFLPYASCDDGNAKSCSSFGEWVHKLRRIARRGDPHDDIWRFERAFVAIYEPDGSAMEFFDVANDPPRTGRPTNAFTWSEFLDEVELSYNRRNDLGYSWTDAPPDTAEVDSGATSTSESDDQDEPEAG